MPMNTEASFLFEDQTDPVATARGSDTAALAAALQISYADALLILKSVPPAVAGGSS